MNNKGYVEDVFLSGLMTLGVLFFVLILSLTIFSKWEVSEDNVSGIVYNTTNNNAFSGRTNFSIRASVDTYVSKENKSSYCLPKESQYKELVNEAAIDKNIKVRVTTKRGFWIKAPWTCIDNVIVTEMKQ